MTRLFYSAGKLRLKLVLTLGAWAALFGALEILVVQRFLDTPRAEAGRHTMLVATGVVVLFVALSIFTWIAMRPTARLLHELRETGRPSRHQDPARFASLRFPSLLSGVALGLGTVVAILAGALSLWFLLTSSEVMAVVVVSSLATILLACGFLYVSSRTLIRPVTLYFRHEDVPAGLRISVRSKVLLAVAVTALFASLPTALICARRIELVRREAKRQQLQQLAEVLAYTGTAVEPDKLRDLLASLSLPGIRLFLSEGPSPTASPLPSGHAATYLEAAGESEPQTNHALLATLVIAGLGLAVLVGLRLGLNLSRDITRVAARVAAIAHPTEPPAPLITSVAPFSDVRRLGTAVNALLERIAKINVANFVAIEKTLAANKLKMQFLANVSHDLRSPLNSILGFSELLLRDLSPKSKDRCSEVLRTMQRAGGELLRLIDEVLDSAKLEAGRFSLQRDDSLPATLVREAVQELHRQGVPEAVKVTAELQAGLPTVWVDPQRLSQAIVYLLRFAVDCSKQGEIVIRVSAQSLTTEHPSGAHKLLLIRISSPELQLPSDHRTLFDGFRRYPGIRGLGLGLPLAKAILEMHDGTLAICSNPEAGATIVASLPVLQRKVLGRLRVVKV